MSPGSALSSKAFSASSSSGATASPESVWCNLIGRAELTVTHSRPPSRATLPIRTPTVGAPGFCALAASTASYTCGCRTIDSAVLGTPLGSKMADFSSIMERNYCSSR